MSTSTLIRREGEQLFVQLGGQRKSAIEELRQGQPDYSRMSPGICRRYSPAATESEIDRHPTRLSPVGDLQGVGPGGRDIYEVKFENGLTEFRIGLTPDGKIEGIGFRPL